MSSFNIKILYFPTLWLAVLYIISCNNAKSERTLVEPFKYEVKFYDCDRWDNVPPDINLVAEYVQMYNFRIEDTIQSSNLSKLIQTATFYSCDSISGFLFVKSYDVFFVYHNVPLFLWNLFKSSTAKWKFYQKEIKNSNYFFTSGNPDYLFLDDFDVRMERISPLFLDEIKEALYEEIREELIEELNEDEYQWQLDNYPGRIE